MLSYNRLTEIQKEIIRAISREKSDLFVEGPPGSGKTLISLYALQDMVKEGIGRPLILMFNYSLYGYLKSSMNELEISDNVTIATKDKFFWDLASGQNIEKKGEGSYNERYEYLLQQLLKCEFEKSYKVTVIDEVQDLKPLEWELIKRISERITSLGDFDQSVYETNLNKDKIGGNGIMRQLNTIFRFHTGIAKLASLFSIKNENLEAKVTNVIQTQPTIIETDVSNEFKKISEILESKKELQKSVGVIAPDRANLQNLANYLKNQDIDHHYFTDNKDFKNHNFTSSTPLLITSQSSKGLEFETVIIFGFNKDTNMMKLLTGTRQLKNILYVSITRTNSSLFIIRRPDSIPEILNVTIESENEDNAEDIDWF